VRIAVFDANAVLVKVLLDSEEQGTLGQFRTPPVQWNFTDAHGDRVKGEFRIYFSAGEFLTSSDVVAP